MAGILTADKTNDLPAMNESTLKASSRRARFQRRVALFGLVALVMTVLAPRAHAACSFTSGGMGRYTISGPSSVGVKRDAINTIIVQTSLTASSGTTVINCSGSGNLAGVVNDVGPQPSSGTQMTFTSTSALSWSWYYSNWSSGYPVYPNRVYGANTINFGTYPGGFQIVLAGSLTQAMTIPAGLIGHIQVGSLRVQEIYLANPITIYPLECTVTTPDVRVNLLSHATSALGGIGSTTQPVDFNVGLNGCAAGMSIQYTIDPATAVVSSANSVVALDASSSASGVGVQLLNSAGTAPFPLSTKQTLTSSSSSSMTYSIPLKARYYQTAASVSAGTANSSMFFTLYYQ